MTGAAPLARELTALGVPPGAVLLVHASLQRVGAAPETVLAALLDVLGPEGTLVVPTFTAENSDTSPAYRDRVRNLTADQVAAYRDRMPPFDPGTTPSQGMGMLAEAVRLSPGAVRSAHPQTSFAALGARAAELTADHDESCHLGPASPLARLEQADARALLLGVGFEVCTSFHLAEYRLPDAPRREYRCVVLRDGERHWTSFEDVALDDGDFGTLGADFERLTAEGPDPVVRAGPVGGADARLFPMAAAVAFATRRLAGKRPRHDRSRPSQNGAQFLH
ncbi:aminoglycoside N(3)-acetyltransferase [Streptomyces sp. M41]|uniref:aminoglycoside N(3)-acetyltransferase n=1 Tax=Streptomyces sp. M41 TaxID=3059412 RepID=UPI00374DCFB3